MVAQKLIFFSLVILSSFAYAEGPKCPHHFIVDYAFDDGQVEDWVRAHTHQSVEAAIKDCEVMVERKSVSEPGTASDIRKMAEFMNGALAKMTSAKPEPSIPTMKMELAKKVRTAIAERSEYILDVSGVWEATSIHCQWYPATDYRINYEAIRPASRMQATQAQLIIGEPEEQPGTYLKLVKLKSVFKKQNGRIAYQDDRTYSGFLDPIYRFEDPQNEYRIKGDQCLANDVGALGCPMLMRFNIGTEILTLYSAGNSPLADLCLADHESAEKVTVTLRKVGELSIK